MTTTSHTINIFFFLEMTFERTKPQKRKTFSYHQSQNKLYFC